MDKDKRDINATRTALLDAAERLMTGCGDPSEVTSRAITREAGVNLAMINYCFGSREALLFEVYNRVREGAMRLNPRFLEIIGGDMPPKEKLIELHIESIKMMLEYYNYTRAITKYVLQSRDISGDMGSLRFIAEHFGGRKTERECRLISYELSALHELLILRHEDINKACGIDLRDEGTLRRIVTENVERFLG